MGGCCSSEVHDELATEVRLAAKPVPAIQQRRSSEKQLQMTAPPEVSAAAVREFIQKASSPGLDVIVLLSNGLGIECLLKIEAGSCLSFAKNELKKTVELKNIKGVIYAPADLKRVKTDARLNNHCAALILHDNTCFVIYLNSTIDRDVFVAAAKSLLGQS